MSINRTLRFKGFCEDFNEYLNNKKGSPLTIEDVKQIQEKCAEFSERESENRYNHANNDHIHRWDVDTERRGIYRNIRSLFFQNFAPTVTYEHDSKAQMIERFLGVMGIHEFGFISNPKYIFTQPKEIQNEVKIESSKINGREIIKFNYGKDDNIIYRHLRGQIKRHEGAEIGHNFFGPEYENEYYENVYQLRRLGLDNLLSADDASIIALSRKKKNGLEKIGFGEDITEELVDSSRRAVNVDINASNIPSVKKKMRQHISKRTKIMEHLKNTCNLNTKRTSIVNNGVVYAPVGEEGYEIFNILENGKEDSEIILSPVQWSEVLSINDRVHEEKSDVQNIH